jgi:hypothetical protein
MPTLPIQNLWGVWRVEDKVANETILANGEFRDGASGRAEPWQLSRSRGGADANV